MSDPADKSDDLIAELAKLMAASPAQPAPAAITRPAPLDPLATSAPNPARPMPVRIPGMDQPRPAAAAPSPAPAPSPTPVAPRAPVTGAIRIPGMDNPAPVATSAPVGKFDFGTRPAPAAPIRQEPLSTLAERLAPQNPAARIEPAAPAPQAPIRVPSDLKPVSENRSFGAAPVLPVRPVAPPPAPAAPSPTPAAPAGDFNFDFGFSRTPPAPAAPVAAPQQPAAPQPGKEEHDPIADLIAAELGGDESDDGDGAHEPPERDPRPAPMPVVRTPAPQQQASQQKPAAPVQPVVPRAAAPQPVPLKPVSVAPRAPEADRFAVSPDAGLNLKPAAGQPPAPPPVPRVSDLPPPKPALDDTDPMAEIESLIGEAVRVELAPPGPVKVQSVAPVAPHVELGFDQVDDDADEIDAVPAQDAPRPAAPVVPPLNSQFAPRRAGLKEESSPASAEDAILAAAAASGATVDHIDPPAGDESPYRRLKVTPARSSWASGGMRQYVGMAVAGTLLLAAGLGLYWVLNMGRGNTLATAEDAPQLTADVTPVKEIPAVQPPAESETARSPVLQQMGGATADASMEQLVSTDQTNGGIVPRDVTQIAASDDTEGGLANRKVRTVTVRPDGTIVSGDNAVAGAEALPVERPNVPAVPGAASETPNLLDDGTSLAMTDPLADAGALALAPGPLATGTTDSLAAGVIDPTRVAPTPMAVPVRTAALAPSQTTTSAAQEPAAISLTGAQTPSGQIDLLGSAIDRPAQVAAAPAPVSSGNAAAYVQLSSSPTEADAQASLRTLNNRYGSLFGGNQLVVQSADLGQKGVWYRVKLPAASVADAQNMCISIKANGGDCIVNR